MSQEESYKIVVFGGGMFGTAMGVVLARNGHKVFIVSRNPNVVNNINNNKANLAFFPSETTKMNDISVEAVLDTSEKLPKLLAEADFIVHSIPVQGSRDYLTKFAKYIPKTTPLLSVSKGIERTTLCRMDEIIPKVLDPEQPTAFLSGPSFAKELLEGQPTAVVIASKSEELARRFQKLFTSGVLKVYTSTDVPGVEVGGALKNVIAIAAGIVEGLGLGMNTMAVLVTRGCSEMRKLAIAMGAKPETLSGLAGIGDLMLTCFGSLSRNRTVGARLGKGEKIDDILKSMPEVAEGVPTAQAAVELEAKYNLTLPIFKTVARVINGEMLPKEAVTYLMSYPSGAED